SKRIIAVLVPNIVEEGETPQEAYDLQAIMYNPKIVSHSVQDAALGEGEGCLSVDRNVPGYVVRHARVTVDYFDKDGEKPLLIVLGNEEDGISDDVRKNCDECVIIPFAGFTEGSEPAIQSLNVAQAASVILYELQKTQPSAH
ncbi:MAG: TrmH family RNA methyltransferase, partial [Treponema socranskii subsp. buccale]